MHKSRTAVSLMDDSEGIGAVHELLSERKLVWRFAVRNLVGAEPLADRIQQPWDHLVHIINILENLGPLPTPSTLLNRKLH